MVIAENPHQLDLWHWKKMVPSDSGSNLPLYTTESDTKQQGLASSVLISG